MNSKSKQAGMRALGQRSISSSFLSRSSNPFKKETADNKLDAKIDSCVSLSDFLDRKLRKTSLLPKKVKGKSCPFSTPVDLRNPNGSVDGQIGVKKEGEDERKSVLDKVVFEQFKHTSNEEEDICPCSIGELETPNKGDVKESRKRKNPFEGADEKHTTHKPFVILGDNPKWKLKGMEVSSMRNNKSKPSYNHYANGCGWWDYNMEGVDNEEIGYGEVWEGVGSTTFGGIEWH